MVEEPGTAKDRRFAGDRLVGLTVAFKCVYPPFLGRFPNVTTGRICWNMHIICATLVITVWMLEGLRIAILKDEREHISPLVWP